MIRTVELIRIKFRIIAFITVAVEAVATMVPVGLLVEVMGAAVLQHCPWQ